MYCRASGWERRDGRRALKVAKIRESSQHADKRTGAIMSRTVKITSILVAATSEVRIDNFHAIISLRYVTHIFVKSILMIFCPAARL